ncbi:MAG TPA: type II secretion system protein N [Ramlibacter sp.]|nr:type II secretion system protein N [Ramlibacter sp.]
MVSNGGSNWTVRGVTFLVWGAALASLAYWGLKLGASSSAPAAVAPTQRQVAPADPMVVAKLLGHTAAANATAAPAAPPLSSRFNLIGVVADRAQQGAALIAVDGRPPKPFRVGSRVEEGLILQSVQARRAVLAASASGPAVVTLELPPLQR